MTAAADTSIQTGGGLDEVTFRASLAPSWWPTLTVPLPRPLRCFWLSLATDPVPFSTCSGRPFGVRGSVSVPGVRRGPCGAGNLKT